MNLAHLVQMDPGQKIVSKKKKITQKLCSLIGYISNIIQDANNDVNTSHPPYCNNVWGNLLFQAILLIPGILNIP